MKDRLIELLEDTLHEWECDVQTETLSQIADHLLANGVIVPPCKVGNKLYRVNQFGETVEYTVRNINCIIITENPYNCFDVSEVGTGFALTKEQAEAELEKRGKENA